MRNRATTFTIGFGVLGLCIILLTIYVQRGMNNSNAQGFGMLQLLTKTSTDISSGRIALQRFVAGDPAVSVDQINAPLQTAKASLQAAYDNKVEAIDLEMFQGEETRAVLKQTIFDVQRLLEIGQVRWKPKAPSVPVVSDSTTIVVSAPVVITSVDPESESAFTTLQSSIENAETTVNALLSSKGSTLKILSYIDIFLFLVALCVVCLWLYKLQVTSKKMIAEQDERLAQTGRAVKSLSGFIESISAGDYSAEVDIEGDSSNLKESLTNMRDKLLVNAEDDRKRNWSTSGLAQIGDILRVNSGSVTELYDNIIKFVVRYTKSNQGGLFIVNEETEGDLFLELVSCYAFERKKYLTRRIGKGEGLVGQCYLEGERIYLAEVPAQYIAITSGLGGASPNALLLVPLKINDKIFGVLELATFGKYEAHEIDLVEKLTESIASTISSVRISESTRILLEKTQQQAEEMRAQEEEMRQNMEELEATQEEMRRKEKHIQDMLDGEKKRNEISNKNRQLIMELTKNKDIQDGNWNESLERVSSSITRQLGISKAGIWEFQRKENRLFCAKVYNHSRGTFESGKIRLGRDYPGFFEAVTSEEIIHASDAQNHPATRELAAEFKSDDIRSVLNVPFFNEGKIAGIISCEHQHEQKEWSEEDIEFLKSCSDLLSVAFNTSRINGMLDQLGDDQETMQTIIDNIPRAVFWKDKDLRFQGCNRIFANVAGLKSPKELIGKTDYDMPWKEHGDAYKEDDLGVMNSRKARLDLEERNVNSAGVESWVLTSKVPVLNKHAEVVAVLGMFEDITERKRKEAQVEANMAELETLRKLVQKHT
ncbi:MAG: GAF domain-containing protein [Chryseolinea sp.]